MAKLFKDEKGFPDNSVRKNFVFLAYPYEPALPKDDYRAVMKELEEELPLRLWYFLDEVTNHELMRKVWRAILRADRTTRASTREWNVIRTSLFRSILPAVRKGLLPTSPVRPPLTFSKE